MTGYHIEAQDGDVGRVENFVLDDATWDIRYVVADTGSWLHERSVLLMPESISAIGWQEGRVYVGLTREMIQGSPTFHNVFPIASEYSGELSRHYAPAESRTEAPARERPLRVLTTRSETKALYDKISRVYDLLADRTEAPIRSMGIKKLDVQPGEIVLEVGFGTGHCLIELARAVGSSGRVFGLDLSDGMVDVAQGLIDKECLSEVVSLERGDAVHLPYADEMMDAVFMTFTLELFDNPEISIVLGECKRVLKVGGRIAIVGMSKEGRPGIAIRAYEWSHRHFPNFVDCRPILVRRAVEAAGFRIRETVMMQMWVPVEIVVGTKVE